MRLHFPEYDRLPMEGHGYGNRTVHPVIPAKKNMAFLRANCYDLVPPDMWPPNSPDLNPMDYFTWGVVESRSNAVAHSNKKSLIAAIKRAFSSLERDMVIKATARFRPCVKAVIDEGGGFIE